MTKIIHEKPEIYERLVKVFGADWDQGIMIADNEVIYTKYDPTPDEIAHEETHLQQQKLIGRDRWWDQYITDSQFRFLQEIEAYRNQVAYMRKFMNLYSRQERRDRIRKCAKLLSGPLYGNLTSYETALEFLK